MRSTQHFPKTLARLMREQEISQQELARRTKSKYDWGSLRTMQLLLQGEMRPTPSAMEHIAGALGVAPETFAEYRLWQHRRQFDPDAEGISLRKALTNLEAAQNGHGELRMAAGKAASHLKRPAAPRRKTGS